jgi:hypothetical protein
MATDGPNDDDNDDTKGTGQDLSGAPTATAAAAVSARLTGGAQQNPTDAAKGSSRGQEEAEQGAQPPLRSIISSIRFAPPPPFLYLLYFTLTIPLSTILGAHTDTVPPRLNRVGRYW